MSAEDISVASLLLSGRREVSVSAERARPSFPGIFTAAAADAGLR